MASTLYRSDGTEEQLHPANGIHWTLAEMQTLVGGCIEVAATHDGRYLICDEEGKLKRKPLNQTATSLYRFGSYDPIAGDALVVDTKLELDGPEDQDET